jgi:hypothetical protein
MEIRNLFTHIDTWKYATFPQLQHGQTSGLRIEHVFFGFFAAISLSILLFDNILEQLVEF